MATRLVTGSSVRQLFASSLQPLVRTIGLSLGPSGRSVLLAAGSRTRCASCAVDIARQFSESEGCRSLAQRMLKETMIASDRELGDGSARLALIACESFGAAVRMLGGQHSAPVADAMMRVRERIGGLLGAERRDVATARDVALAAGVDEALADVLAGLFRKVGCEGVIDVQPSGRPGWQTEVSSGFMMDAVPISPGTTADDRLVLPDVHVIAAREVIADFGTLVPVIEGFASRRKSLLIVARDVTGSALAALERNRGAGVLSVLAMKPADAGPRGDSVIGDLAVATGASLVAETEGISLRALKPSGLGKAASLRLSGNRLFLDKPRGEEAAIRARSAELEAEIVRNRYLSLDREHAQRRCARLHGRWAEIRIGAASSFETDSLVTAARSAVACMRSAQRHGVVSGAGRGLSRVADALEHDSRTGAEAVAALAAARGLRSIERHLRANAGLPEDFGPRAVRLPGSRPFVPDPLRMTGAVVDQALSLASMMLSVDAAVYRTEVDRAA